MRYQFGEFELDTRQWRLTRAGAEVPAQPRVLEVLHHLVSHPGDLLERGRLMREVWGVAVGESAVTQTLRKLRTALEDDEAAPRFVETVPRRGYRFVAPVVRMGDEADPRLVALQDAVAHHRVVTLHGPAGIGKSWLAARLSALRVPLRVGVSVEEAVATALALGHSGNAAVAAGLAARTQPVLLDGAEGAVEALRGVLPGWLEHAPALRIVVTSRRTLDLPQERVLPVLPLSSDEAAALYRSEASRTGTLVTDTPELRALVARLDHNPRAVELAAARAPVLPPDVLLGRLHARFVVMPDLDAMFAWSWDQLDPADRRALVALSVFSGPFSLADAEGVAEPGAAGTVPTGAAWIGTALERLLAHALVGAHAGGFHLGESLRAWLAVREPEARAAALARLAAALVPRLTPLAARLPSRPDPGAIPTLRRWLPELAAIGTPDALLVAATLLDVVGDVPAGLRLLDGAEAPILRVRRAALAARGGLTERARADLDAVAAQAGAAGRGLAKVPRAEVARAEAILLAARADAGAVDVREQARALASEAETLGDPVCAATAANAYAIVLRRAGDAGGAQRVLRAALAGLPADADLPRAVLLANQAVGHLHAGEPKEATELLELALATYEALGLPSQTYTLRLNLAAAHLDAGRADTAEAAFAAVESATRSAGLPMLATVAAGNRATAALLAGRLDVAAAGFGRLLQEADTNARLASWACWGLATTARFAGRAAAARSWIDRGLAYAPIPVRHRGLLLAARVGVDAEAGSLADARDGLATLQALATGHDEPVLAALVPVLTAAIARASGGSMRARSEARFVEVTLEEARSTGR
ncbi:MAG: winged helix-turn-helix domain-containing protein [Myxococcota bacterium]